MRAGLGCVGGGRWGRVWVFGIRTVADYVKVFVW